MSWGMVAVAGASLVGGAMSAKGSKDAAQSQAGAAADATAAEREMLERQIELQEPWRQAGGTALNRLMYLSGLSPTGTFTPGQTSSVGAQPGAAPSKGAPALGAPSGQPATAETRDQIKARLAPKYVTQGSTGSAYLGGGAEGEGGWQYGPASAASQLDAAALDAAVDAELAKQQKAAQAQQTQTSTAAAAAAAKDPAYGSLLNGFQMKDFTAKDFQVDPGYKFRQEEGELAIDRGAAAAGRYNSGRVLKDLTRFNSGLASQEYGNAYNRFNTNQANQFNAFQTNQSNQYNRLASMAGVGQTATNQMSGAAGAYGAAAGANAIGAGNALAAGQVGAANAISGGISQGIGSYQQNQLLQQFARSGTSMYGAPANPYYAG